MIITLFIFLWLVFLWLAAGFGASGFFYGACQGEFSSLADECRSGDTFFAIVLILCGPFAWASVIITGWQHGWLLPGTEDKKE